MRLVKIRHSVTYKHTWTVLTASIMQNVSISPHNFIDDCGHGEGFCMGNILKYAQRYGRKNGHNRADLMKILHYGIIMLHIHDNKEGD